MKGKIRRFENKVKGFETESEQPNVLNKITSGQIIKEWVMTFYLSWPYKKRKSFQSYKKIKECTLILKSKSQPLSRQRHVLKQY